MPSHTMPSIDPLESFFVLVATKQMLGGHKHHPRGGVCEGAGEGTGRKARLQERCVVITRVR